MALEFSEVDLDVLASLLERRYGRAVAFESADVELPVDGAVETCPALYWEARQAHFVVCKVAEGRYRGQFFEGDSAPQGTARSDFEDLGDCVTALLRLQSDHERARAGAVSGATASSLGSEDDYHGPTVI